MTKDNKAPTWLLKELSGLSFPGLYTGNSHIEPARRDTLCAGFGLLLDSRCHVMSATKWSKINSVTKKRTFTNCINEYGVESRINCDHSFRHPRSCDIAATSHPIHMAPHLSSTWRRLRRMCLNWYVIIAC